MTFNEKHKEILLSKKSIAQIGIIRKKSKRPHVSPVWFLTSEEELKNGILTFNSAVGRIKAKNLELGSSIYISILDPDNIYSYIGIEGVIKAIIIGEEAETHIDTLAFKYLGKEKYPFRKEGEQRIKYVVKIIHTLPYK